MVGCDVELSKSSSSRSDEDGHEDNLDDDDDDRDDRDEQDEDGYDEHGSDIIEGNTSERDNERPVMMNPAELKNMFKLDPRVEARLAKLK